MSVTLSEWMNSPFSELPEWETRSVSVKPGVLTSQESVLMGMWCLSKVPGLVRPYRRFFSWRFLALRRRSMVAGLVARSCFWTGSEIAKRLMAQGAHNGRRALSRVEHG